MRITSWMCLVLLCFFSKTTAAQIYIDLVNAGFSQNLDTEYQGFNQTYQQQTTWINVNIPWVLNDKGDFLLPGLQYSYTELLHDFFEADKLSFHHLNLGVSWLKNWKDTHWASYVDLSTAVSSDWKTINREHYNYSATVLLFYEKDNKLVWNFGMNYTGGSFGNYIAPLVGVDWRINQKTTLSCQTFSHLQLDYRLAPRIYSGFIAHSTPFSFHLTDYYGERDSYIHTYSDEFPYVPQSIGIYTDVYLKNELVLFGKAGYEFSKTLSHARADGTFIRDSPYQGEIKPGVLFEIGVAWRKRTARKFRYP